MIFENKNFTIRYECGSIFIYDMRDKFSLEIPYTIMNLDTLIEHLIIISKLKYRDINMDKYIYDICGMFPPQGNYITIKYVKEYLPYLKILNNDFSDIENIDVANLKLVYQDLLKRKRGKNETSSSRKRKNNSNS